MRQLLLVLAVLASGACGTATVAIKSGLNLHRFRRGRFNLKKA